MLPRGSSCSSRIEDIVLKRATSFVMALALTGGFATAAEVLPVAHSKERATIAHDAGDMPEAVVHTKLRLIDMAGARNLDAFVAAMKRAGDKPKLSPVGTADPQKLWPDAFPDSKGAGALDEILQLLSAPGLKHADGSVEWPFYASIDFARLAPDERSKLDLLLGSAQLEDIEAHGYLGWRIKIAGNGRWLFFLPGG
jgi:hypothetical protein